MQIDIREAFPCDYHAIHSLITNELGYAHIDYDKLYVRLELMKLDNKYLTLIADYEGTVVGFMGMQRGLAYNVVGEYIQITALAVLNDLQNKGIGGQLLKWAEEYAFNNDIHRIVLTSRSHRTGAHAFYKSNGYVMKSYGFKKEL